jgi:hypothetical protein
MKPMPTISLRQKTGFRNNTLWMSPLLRRDVSQKKPGFSIILKQQTLGIRNFRGGTHTF